MSLATPPWVPQRRAGRLAVCVVLAAAYFLAARLGLSMTFVNASASPVWPPTGVAIAAVLVLGRWTWPGVAVGAYLANALTTGWSWPSVVIAGGNTLEALAAAWIVKRYADGPEFFRTTRGLLLFTGLAAFGATAVSASVGVGTLVLSDNAPAELTSRIWLTWWLGDAAGALLVGIPLIVWSSGRPDGHRLAESLLLLALVGAISILVFTPALGTDSLVLLALPLALVAWAGWRLGPGAAAAVAAIVAAAAVLGTLRNEGPLVLASPNSQLLALQGYVAVVSLLALLLSTRRPATPTDAAGLRRNAVLVGTAAATTVALTGAAVLVGWFAGIQRLQAPIEGYSAMKFNTALCLLALAVGLLLGRDGRKLGAPLVLVLALPILIGSLTIVQYSFGVDLYIDELFMDDPANALNGVPGRMSPLTAAGLVTLAVGALVRDRRSWGRAVADAAACLGIAIGLLAITGTIYGAQIIPSAVQVAPHTALSLMLAGLALPLLQPTSGLGGALSSDEVDGRLARIVPLGSIILPLALGLVRLELQREGLLSLEQGVVMSIFGTMVIVAIVAALTISQARGLLAQRSKAEAATRRLEEHTRAVLDAAPDATLVVDAAGRIVRANGEAARLFGYTHTELLALGVEALVPDGVRPRHASLRDSYMRDAKVRPMGVGLQLHGRRKDGGLVPVEISLSPLQGPDGLQVIAAVRDVTKQREAQEALRKTLRSVQEAERVTGRGSWEWDITKDRAVWSEGMYRLFGLDPATFVNSNENFLAMVQPEDQPRMGQAIADALAKPGRFFQEYRLRRPDGEIRWIQGEGDVVPDADGKARLVYGIVQDITDLRRLQAEREAAERELSASANRFQALFAANPVGIAIVQSDGKRFERFVDVNPAYETLTGYTRKQLLASDFDPGLLFAKPQSRPGIGKAVQGRGEASGLDFLLRRADGTERAVVVSLRPLELDGKPCMLAAALDVTEERHAQEQVRRAQERFATVFQLSPVPISLTKSDGAFVDANDAFCELFGHARDDLLSGRIRATVLWADPEERNRMLIGLREHGIVRDLEVRVKRKDGQVRTTLANLEFVDVGGGTTILTVLQDITERKRLESERAARAASEAELERLRRNETFRTEFINNTAHELRTPLTPLILHVHGLANDARLSADQQRIVEAVERNVLRLKRLVDDMVGAADLQARALSLDRRRLNLTRELEAAVAAYAVAAERSGIDLRGPENGGFTVSADPQRLQLVLGHLLGNALKFTPKDGRVWITTRRSADDVRIEIQDTGIGLTPTQMEGLWRPFSQAHDKGQKTDSGSGLGLYVTKGIVELHGGEVGCSSPGPGKGSTFWFTLPLAVGHVDPLAKAGPADEKPEGPKRNLNPTVKDE